MNDLYWNAVARLAWDIIREKALVGEHSDGSGVKEWEDLGADEHLALTEFAKATGEVLKR